MIAVAAAAAVVVGASVAGVRAVRAERARRRRDRELRAAVRVMVAELAAGARPVQVLQAAAELACSATFRAAASAAGRGEDVAAVLGQSDRLAPVALAWSVAARYGAPLADVLDRVAADLDARDAQDREVTAALAGPQSSSALLTALPVLGIVLGSAMGAAPVPVLVGTRAGHAALLGGVLLNVAGAAWTWRLASRARRPP